MVKIWIRDNTLNSTVCYNCGKAGHKRSNCWKNTNWGSRQSHNADIADQDQEEEDDFAFQTSACMVTSGEATVCARFKT